MSDDEKPYKKLIVWQRGYEFVLEVYRLSETFPKREWYGLTSQLRRAAVSVLANIVEGSAKRSLKDFLRFLDIAKGSLWECEFLLELSKDLHYLTQDDFQHLDELRAKTAYLLHRLTIAISSHT
jgi:four helix bundle protein